MIKCKWSRNHAQAPPEAPDKHGRTAMGFWSRTRRGLWGAALAGAVALGACPAEAAGKFKIFLSMSYIGNDWQAEAANMVKAMASHASLADKVDLQVQVAGPNAQR